MAFEHLESFDVTDVGRKRKNNEDAVLRLPSNGLFCVADGMGGVEDGEVASQAVVNELRNALRAQAPGGVSPTAAVRDVRVAVNAASRWIKQRADSKGAVGTGTTVVLLLFNGRTPTQVRALHAGDSRAYRLRGGKLEQLMKDHSIMAELGLHDEKEVAAMFRNVVTRAVGLREAVELDEDVTDVQEGDIFLVCSDGLTRMVPDAALRKLLVKGREDSAEKLARRLVDEANAAGGEDNVSVVLVKVGPLPAPLAETAGQDAERVTAEVAPPRGLVENVSVAAGVAAELAARQEDTPTPHTDDKPLVGATPQVDAAPERPAPGGRRLWLGGGALVVLLVLAVTAVRHLPTEDARPTAPQPPLAGATTGQPPAVTAGTAPVVPAQEADAQRVAAEARVREARAEEARQAAAAAETARLARAADDKRKAEAEAEQTRLAREADAARQAQEAEVQRLAEEARAREARAAEARQAAAAVEAARQAREADDRRKAEAETARQAQEAEAARQAQAAEARRAAEETRAREAREAEAKRQADETARLARERAASLQPVKDFVGLQGRAVAVFGLDPEHTVASLAAFMGIRSGDPREADMAALPGAVKDLRQHLAVVRDWVSQVDAAGVSAAAPIPAQVQSGMQEAGRQAHSVQLTLKARLMEMQQYRLTEPRPREDSTAAAQQRKALDVQLQRLDDRLFMLDQIQDWVKQADFDIIGQLLRDVDDFQSGQAKGRR